MNPSSNYPVFSHITEILSAGAARFPLKTAFCIKEENGRLINISYKRFHTDVLTLSFALNKILGIRKSKVGISMKNCYKWCVSYFAVLSSDNVCVPLDKDLITDDLIHLIKFGSLQAIFTDEKTASVLLSRRDELPEGFIIITTALFQGKNVFAYDTLTASVKKEELPADLQHLTKGNSAEELAVLLFTSGTTGMAKGVMLSNKNVCSNVNSVIKLVDINEKDSTLCVLPLHHAYQSIVVLMMLSVGGSISFCENIRHTSSDLLLYKPTVFVTVPLMLEKIHEKILKEAAKKGLLGRSVTSEKALGLVSKISNTDFKRKLFSSVHASLGGNIRMVITGAAKMNEKIARDFTTFAIPVIIGYGLTECSPIAICNSVDDIRPDSIGKPIPGAEADIFSPDEDGIGEIIVKGPMVMLGYYENKKETEKVIKDGWLYTGDMGYRDKEGYYHITGRIKNVIVTKNGKNIYPEELEYYLNTSHYITESLVYAEGGEDEKVCALIVYDEEKIKKHLKKERLTENSIYAVINNEVKNLNAKLPSYKAIKSFKVQKDALQKTSTHKIKRNIQ